MKNTEINEEELRKIHQEYQKIIGIDDELMRNEEVAYFLYDELNWLSWFADEFRKKYSYDGDIPEVMKHRLNQIQNRLSKYK